MCNLLPISCLIFIILQRDAKTFFQSSSRRSFNIWSALHHLWCTSSCLSDIWNWGTHLCYLVPIYILPVDIGFIHWKYLYDFGNHYWKVNSLLKSMNFVYPVLWKSNASEIMMIFILIVYIGTLLSASHTDIES